MLYPFSLPTKSDKVPTGSDWIHEIKYDGYRMAIIREQDRVRLISRGGYDWADRFPLIVSAALKLEQESFVIDGELVVLDKEGKSDFDALALAQARQVGDALCLRHAERRRRGPPFVAVIAA
jgi:ATP-dependent DNA ligase